MLDVRLNNIFENKFFKGLKREEFLEINTDLMVERKFNSGKLIIEQDKAGNVMYLIISGEVLITKVVADNEIELARRKDGDYFGEMALFDNQPRSANVKAITDVLLYEICTKSFFEMLNLIDQLKINIIKTINTTVRETGIKLGENSIVHNRQISVKESELSRTRALLEETIELKRNIDEQKSELVLINRELEKRNKELYQLTIIDDVTRLYSKNHFEALLETEYSRSFKHGMSFAVMVLNVDNFTAFNEQYGHFTGDRVLKESSGYLSSIISPEDVAGRINGDCVGIIMPHSSIDNAVELGSKILKMCSENSFRLNGVSTAITVTVGVSDNIILNPKSGSDILNHALTALKIGKKEGKNCLRVMS